MMSVPCLTPIRTPLCGFPQHCQTMGSKQRSLAAFEKDAKDWLHLAQDSLQDPEIYEMVVIVFREYKRDRSDCLTQTGF